jgi:hypothetical protein
MAQTLRRSAVIILTILDLRVAVAMVAEVVMLVVLSLVPVEVVLQVIAETVEKDRQADMGVPLPPPQARVAVAVAVTAKVVMGQQRVAV